MSLRVFHTTHPCLPAFLLMVDCTRRLKLRNRIPRSKEPPLQSQQGMRGKSVLGFFKLVPLLPQGPQNLYRFRLSSEFLHRFLPFEKKNVKIKVSSRVFFLSLLAVNEDQDSREAKERVVLELLHQGGRHCGFVVVISCLEDVMSDI